ncbi:hypothetical protein ABIA38_004637 [Embleya sp. AB8]
MALSAGFAGLVLAGAPGAAQAHPVSPDSGRVAGDRVSIDSTVWAAGDGTLTVSGTYRCAPVHTGRVLVGGSVDQAAHHAAMTGTVATCDGNEHAWRTGEKQSIPFLPGTATGDASMLELQARDGLVPVATHVLATDSHDVEIKQA